MAEDEIQKVDPRVAGLAKARAAKAAKRAAELANPQSQTIPSDDGFAAMQAVQASKKPKRQHPEHPQHPQHPEHPAGHPEDPPPMQPPPERPTVEPPSAPPPEEQPRQPEPQQGFAPEQAAARGVTRTVNGRTEAVGRGGEVLSRKRTSSGDIFDVPESMIPKGWRYQWCAVSVTGNTEILLDQNLMFAENGWRPVPASRYPGRYMPQGHTGSIIRGSQMLMERPESLCKEAQDEDVRLAKQLISDRNDSLKLSGVRKNMPDGFEMGQQYRGTGGDIRMSIDRALDVPAPSHKIAEPGE